MFIILFPIFSVIFTLCSKFKVVITVQNRTHIYTNFLITKAKEIVFCSNVHNSSITLYMDVILHISRCFWYWIRGMSYFLDSIYVKIAVSLTVLKRLSILSPDSSDYIQFIKPFAQNVNHSNMSVMLKVNYSASVILFTSCITEKKNPSTS